MNTNGTSERPNAIAAPGLAMPPSSSEATVTSPAIIAQYAGTSSNVARVMARHFRWGDSGAAPASPRRERERRLAAIA